MTSKNITLNVWKDNNELAMAMQGEVNSRFLTVNLVDNSGAIDLTNKTVYFVSKNPDGTLVFNNMTIDDAENGIATLALTLQISAVPGLISGGEIHIISESGETLIAKKINIFIQSSLRATVNEKVLELNDMEELLNLLQEHTENTSNPHNVTAAQVGALPTSTEYGSQLEADGTTLKLKDQNGNILDSVTTYDTTYSNATTNAAGLMSAADKSKLDGIASGAEINVQANWAQTSSSADDYIKNKPIIPSNLNDLLGVLPIAKGGTGASTIESALNKFKFYYSASELNLEYPTTTISIIETMPNRSVLIEQPETISNTITDVPASCAVLIIIKYDYRRILALTCSSLSDLKNGNRFYIGEYNRNISPAVMTWNKIFTNNSDCIVPIANGGTGANTASSALTALGAQASTDNSLLTNNKTIVGAINEIHNAGYLTTETDPTVPAWAKAASKPTYSYSEIENTPAIPLSLTDLTGTLPINQGGTGATNVLDALANMHLYTSVDQLGLSYPCTTVDILGTMPDRSILIEQPETISNTITDVPASCAVLIIIKYDYRRILALTCSSLSDLKNGNRFYIGEYNRNISPAVMTWNKIFTNNSDCIVPIENGGTGASTAVNALNALGAASKSVATNSSNGLMSSTDKSKLDSISILKITLNKNNWNNNSITVSINEVTQNSIVIAVPAPGYNSYDIICSSQGNQSLTFTCSTTPIIDIPICVFLKNG